MNTKILVPLAAFGLLAVTTAAANFASFPTDASADVRIVDLPAVTVHPAPQDLAYFRTRRIIDLPRITVRPEPADMALLLAENSVRIAHSPIAPPRASVLDTQMAAASSQTLAKR